MYGLVRTYQRADGRKHITYQRIEYHQATRGERLVDNEIAPNPQHRHRNGRRYNVDAVAGEYCALRTYVCVAQQAYETRFGFQVGVRLYAETLKLLGRKHALVVRGNDGLDEISICDETKIVEIKDGKILEYTIAPEMFGFKRAFHADIEGGSPDENAEILLRILKGEEKSAKRDIVVLNAMFALYTAEVVKHPADAKALIEEALESGKVYEYYLKYIM